MLGAVAYTLIISVLWRQRWANLREFEASQVYIASPRPGLHSKMSLKPNFKFCFNYVCMCVGYGYMSADAKGAQRHWIPEATDGSAGNQACILWKSRTHAPNRRTIHLPRL